MADEENTDATTESSAPWAQTYVLLSDIRVDRPDGEVRRGSGGVTWEYTGRSWRAAIDAHSYKLPYTTISLLRVPAMRVIIEGCGNTIPEAIEKLQELLKASGVEIR